MYANMIYENYSNGLEKDSRNLPCFGYQEKFCFDFLHQAKKYKYKKNQLINFIFKILFKNKLFTVCHKNKKMEFFLWISLILNFVLTFIFFVDKNCFVLKLQKILDGFLYKQNFQEFGEFRREGNYVTNFC